jgi:hypothetical protein
MECDVGTPTASSHGATLHMPLFSASMDGQGAMAAQAARDYAKVVTSDGASFLAQVLARLAHASTWRGWVRWPGPRLFSVSNRSPGGIRVSLPPTSAQ